MLVLSVVFTSFGQFSNKIDTLVLIKNKADTFFLKDYVPDNFKDPYSYKPLKTTVTAIYLPVKMKDDADEYKEIAALYYKDTNSSIIEIDQHTIVEDSLLLNKAKKAYKQTWIDEIKLHQKMIVEQRKIIDSANYHINYYLNASNKILLQLDSLSESEKHKIVYYIIQHDCYGANSYGNLILGRYMFKYDIKEDKFYGVIRNN